MSSSLSHADFASLNKTQDIIKTNVEVPDPTPLPVPHAWMVMVRPVPVRKVTKGGIIMPDTLQRDYANLTTVGRVVAFGADVFKVGNATQSYTIGDYVVWSRLRGERFVYKGVSFVLIADDDVLMTVEAPEDLNPDNEVEA